MQNDTPDEFPGLLAAMQEHFANFKSGPLFLTAASSAAPGTADDLWTIFLENIPPELKQHYTCNSCRHFVHRYGSLVSIDDRGRVTSALWSKQAPAPFTVAFELMAKAVENSPVWSVLISSDKTLGTPSTVAEKTGVVWTHFTVELARAHRHPLLTAPQVAAERREDYKILQHCRHTFPLHYGEHARVSAWFVSVAPRLVNLLLRVTTANAVAVYCIDRWD